MSIKLVTRVWELDLPRGQMFLLLAMADFANDQGSGVFAGVDYLAWKSSYERRQVLRHLDALRKLGVLVLASPPGEAHPTAEYRLNLARAPRKKPFMRRPAKRSALTNGTARGKYVNEDPPQ